VGEDFFTCIQTSSLSFSDQATLYYRVFAKQVTDIPSEKDENQRISQTQPRHTLCKGNPVKDYTKLCCAFA
jgi:hypothetical protein